jgi:hypothetical protein
MWPIHYYTSHFWSKSWQQQDPRLLSTSNFKDQYSSPYLTLEKVGVQLTWTDTNLFLQLGTHDPNDFLIVMITTHHFVLNTGTSRSTLHQQLSNHTMQNPSCRHCYIIQHVWPEQCSVMESSYSALNMIGSGSMRELNYISNRLDGSVRPADVVKPVGLHFVVQDKISLPPTNLA